MKRLFFTIGALVLLVAPALAQQREFLTSGEIDQIREAQEPDRRLRLYADFARIRIDAIARLLQSKEADRGSQIHDALYEYDRILDAIDKNVDQAQQRRDPLKKGLQYVLDQEPAFLKQLEALQAANPADLEQYKFILDQAIGNTRDGIDSLAGVLSKQPKSRAEEKEAKARAEKEQQKRAAPPGGAGQKASDPASQPGWNPNVGPPTRKKAPEQQQTPPQQQPPAKKPPEEKPPGQQ